MKYVNETSPMATTATAPDVRDLSWQQFSNALQLALGDYQYIEEALRMYIAAAYELWAAAGFMDTTLG